MSESREVGTGPVNRRDLLRLTILGGTGLALDGLIDVPAMRAATRNLRLSEIAEFTPSCNFCSCGCGMIASVRATAEAADRPQLRIPIDALVHDAVRDRYLVYGVEEKNGRTVAKAKPRLAASMVISSTLFSTASAL